MKSPCRFALLMLLPAVYVIALPPAPLSPAARRSQGEPEVVIVGATLIDVRAGRSQPNTTILFRHGRIRSVGSSMGVHIPDGARVMQANGSWVVPGLIDMHVHVSTMPNVPFELYVVNGVTTIRDLGGHLTALRVMRESEDTRDRPHPRLFFAGAMLDGLPPSAPRISIIADSPRRAAKSVRLKDLEEWKLVMPPEADRIRAMTSVTEREAAVWDHVALDAAKALGQENALGAVEVGKLADVVILKADPLEDITHLRAIEAVVSGGQIFERSTLDALLNRLEAAAAKDR